MNDQCILNVNQVKKLVRAIVALRHEEMTCDICFHELDQYVELTLAGKNAAEAMPMVQSHLQGCTDCGEEFQALVDALKAIEAEKAQKENQGEE
ncbi:MAG: hypothetical protein Fur0022_38460 [Anaerolineales bacterium]